MADTLEKIMANLNKEIKGIENRSMGGMLAAGLKVQAGSQKQIPVEYGNLRGSAFTRKAQDGSLAAEVGYSAYYAIYVHENMEQVLKGKPRPSGLGRYWGPPFAPPKFLERVVTEKQSEIIDTIAAHARVKK